MKIPVNGKFKIEKCFVKSLLQTSQMIKEWHRHALDKLKIGTLLPFQFSILKKRNKKNDNQNSIFNFQKLK